MLRKFHDAELNEIRHDRSLSTVLLSFTNEDGSTATITFQGVCGLRVVDYGLQNVVSRLLSSDEIKDHEDIRKNVIWIKGTSEGKCLVNASAVEKLVDEIEGNRLRLFVLEPSWGAEIGILAQSFSIKQSGTPISRPLSSEQTNP